MDSDFWTKASDKLITRIKITKTQELKSTEFMNKKPPTAKRSKKLRKKKHPTAKRTRKKNTTRKKDFTISLEKVH